MGIHSNFFHHSLLKSYTVAMGTLLTGLEVVRLVDGVEDHRIPVPVSYMNKEKFIRRITEDPDLTRQTAITLPRISFGLSGLQWAPDRKLSSRHEFVFLDPVQTTQRVYTPVPYDMVFEATVITKTQEDMLQIIEQILPFFTPDYTLTMKGVTNPNISFDVPITLDTVMASDSAEGRFEENRMIIWSMSFVVKGYFFGPVRNGSIIKHVDVSVYDTDQLPNAPELRKYLVDYNIEPYIPDVPLANINFDDDFTIRTEVIYG